jgi:hypothetical protein
VKNRQIAILPPPRLIKEREDEEPLPGEPPKIWAQWTGLINEPLHEPVVWVPPGGNNVFLAVEIVRGNELEDEDRLLRLQVLGNSVLRDIENNFGMDSNT